MISSMSSLNATNNNIITVNSSNSGSASLVISGNSNSNSNNKTIYVAAPLFFLICFGVYSTVLNESTVQNLKVYQAANISALPTSNRPVDQLKKSIKPPACMTSAEYHHIHATIEAAQTRIWEFWDISHYPLFLTTMSIPTKSWDIQKLKFTKMLLERKRLNHPFVVGFSGSSVTAGHDSYFREAYPQVFYDSLQPVFAALNGHIGSGTDNAGSGATTDIVTGRGSGGVNLTVRNHALGNRHPPRGRPRHPHVGTVHELWKGC